MSRILTITFSSVRNIVQVIKFRYIDTVEQIVVNILHIRELKFRSNVGINEILQL